MGSSISTSLTVASTNMVETLTDTHEFTVRQYGLFKGMGVGKSIIFRSFIVGGHSWFIRFYPGGYSAADADFVAIFLEMLDKPERDVNAEFSFELVDKNGAAVFKGSSVRSRAFNLRNNNWGHRRFVQRRNLEESGCIYGDSLTIRCSMAVITPRRTHKPNAWIPSIDVPPSHNSTNFLWLLESGAAADVTFFVSGTIFSAHKNVLATQSPVFRAELLGPMKEASMQCIRIEDMSPSVFQALLHFMYSGSMPPPDMCASPSDSIGMAQELFAAADRYGLERMKLMCAEELCKYINKDTVTTILALAEQHYCFQLKAACDGFIRESRRTLLERDTKAQAWEGFWRIFEGLKIDVKFQALPN